MKKYVLSNILALCLFAFVNSGFEGLWMMNDEKFMIHITKADDGEYKGYVDWLKYPVYPEGDKEAGVQQYDRNNSKEELRDRKIIGLQNVGELYKNKKGKLTGGWVYDTWNGNKYYGSAKLIDENTLSLKGSIDKWGILGYAMKAKRVDNPKKYFAKHVTHHE